MVTKFNYGNFEFKGQASTRVTNRQPTVEGWMIHFMLDQPERRLRHYWILTGGAINMYNEYNEGNKIHKWLGILVEST